MSLLPTIDTKVAPWPATGIVMPAKGRQVWMVSFADLMAILMTFMVVAFSTREMEEKSWQIMSQSMQNVFQSGVAPVDREAAPDFRQVVRLVEDGFPQLVEAGGMTVTAAGVELDLAAIGSRAGGLADLAGLLIAVDRSLMVRVVAPIPDANPTSVQRTLAWEKGLADAIDLHARLTAEGLVRDLRISVSVAVEQAAGTTLLIERSVGEGL